MKSTTTLLLATVYHLVLFSQTWTNPREASKHVGSTVNLIGFVSNVKYVAHTKLSRMLIEVDDKGSTQFLTLLISKTDRLKFKEDPQSLYLNRYVQLKGKVETFKGKPGIILINKSQIQF